MRQPGNERKRHDRLHRRGQMLEHRQVLLPLEEPGPHVNETQQEAPSGPEWSCRDLVIGSDPKIGRQIAVYGE